MVPESLEERKKTSVVQSDLQRTLAVVTGWQARDRFQGFWILWVRCQERNSGWNTTSLPFWGLNWGRRVRRLDTLYFSVYRHTWVRGSSRASTAAATVRWIGKKGEKTVRRACTDVAVGGKWVKYQFWGKYHFKRKSILNPAWQALTAIGIYYTHVPCKWFVTSARKFGRNEYLPAKRRRDADTADARDRWGHGVDKMFMKLIQLCRRTYSLTHYLL